MSMPEPRYAPGRSPAIAPGEAAYAPASIDIRWFVGIAVAVPLFVAGGVYWLHHLPAGQQTDAGGGLVEISLVRTAEPQLATASIQTPEIETPSEVQPPPEPPLPEVADETEPLPTPAAYSPPSGQDQPPGVLSNLPQRPSSSAMATFRQSLSQHLLRFKPKSKSHDPKVTIVRFIVRRDGMVSSVWVQNSSGDFLFDQAAMDTVRRAQPLPAIPPDLPDQMSWGVPITFAGQ
jgi:protein TonB